MAVCIISHCHSWQGLLTLTAQRCAGETWKAHPSCWGSVPLGPNFTGTGSSPAIMLIPFDRYLIVLQHVLGRNFCERRPIWVSEPNFRKLGVTCDLVWWLFGKPMVDFLYALLELFCYLLRFRSYEAKYIQLSCFCRGLASLHWNYTWIGSSPINHSWSQKTSDTGLHNGGDCASLYAPSFWHNTGVWQTDAQTEGFAIAYKAFALQCAVIIYLNKWTDENKIKNYSFTIRMSNNTAKYQPFWILV